MFNCLLEIYSLDLTHAPQHPQSPILKKIIILRCSPSPFYIVSMNDSPHPSLTHTPVCTRTLGVHAVFLLYLTIHMQADVEARRPFSCAPFTPVSSGTDLICILLGDPQWPSGLPVFSLHLCCKALFLPQKK